MTNDVPGMAEWRAGMHQHSPGSSGRMSRGAATNPSSCVRLLLLALLSCLLRTGLVGHHLGASLRPDRQTGLFEIC
jgi:hypothetical protein